MNTALSTRIFGNKFLFDGAAVELGFIPVETVDAVVSGSSEAVLVISSEGSWMKTAQGGVGVSIYVVTEGAGQGVFAEGGSEVQVIVLVEAAGRKLARSPPNVEARVLVIAEGSGRKCATSGAEAHVLVHPEVAGQAIRQGAMDVIVSVCPEAAGEYIIRWYTHPGHALPVVVDNQLRPVALLSYAHEMFVNETLAGEDKLAFKIPHPAPAELVVGALLDLAGKIYRDMILGNKEDGQGARFVEVEAWALWYDLAKMPELPAQEWLGASIPEILAWLLPGSGWTTGTVAITARHNLRWDGGVNRLECLRKMERVFNAEIVWDTVRRTVSVIPGGGIDTNMFFLRGKNLRKVEVEKNIVDMVHRLYPRGHKGLTIADANNGIPYLEVPSPYDPPPSAVLVADEFTDPQQLKHYAEAVFATMNTPRESYLCGVIDISVLPGHGDETIRLGDVVTIYDEDLDINVKTRVVRMRYNVEEPWNSDIDLSTVEQNIGSIVYQHQHDILQLEAANATLTDVVETVRYLSINNQFTSYTLVLADDARLVDVDSDSMLTLTVPTNASVPFPVGTQVLVRQQGVGQVIISPASGVTLNTATGENKSRAQFSIAGLVKVASDTWAVFGDLVP